MVRGASALSLDFLIKGAPDGVGPMLVGTGVIVAIAALIAMPIGVLIALFLTEYRGRRLTALIQLTLDLMNGLPSIIIGIFVFILLVEPEAGSRASSASVALAIIMVPLIARGTQEVLLLVPKQPARSRRRARRRPLARGADDRPAERAGRDRHRDRALRRPGCRRDGAAGFCQRYLRSLDLLPESVRTAAERAGRGSSSSPRKPSPTAIAEAWGLSLVLVALILFASLGARALLARSKRKMAS